MNHTVTVNNATGRETHIHESPRQGNYFARITPSGGWESLVPSISIEQLDVVRRFFSGPARWGIVPSCSISWALIGADGDEPCVRVQWEKNNGGYTYADVIALIDAKALEMGWVVNDTPS